MTTDPQEQYWQLAGDHARALLALQDAEEALDEHLANHPDTAFKVFRPEDIARAFKPDIVQWDV